MLKLVGGAVGGVLFLLVVIGGCWVVVRWRSRKPSTPIILGVGGEEGATHIPSVSLHIEETIHPPMSSPELEGGGSEGSDSPSTASEHMDQVSDLGTRDSWAGSPNEEVELGYRILNSHSHNIYI